MTISNHEDIDLDLHAVEAQHLANGHYRPRTTMKSLGVSRAVHAGLDERIVITAGALRHWEVDEQQARAILENHVAAAINEINNRLI